MSDNTKGKLMKLLNLYFDCVSTHLIDTYLVFVQYLNTKLLQDTVCSILQAKSLQYRLLTLGVSK